MKIFEKIREKKLNKLETELLAMAREEALKHMDEVVADIAARRILDEFVKMQMTLRAVDYGVLYGAPKSFVENKDAFYYVAGGGFKNYLANNPEKVKKDLSEFMGCLEIRVSSMTEKKENTDEN